MALPTLYSHWRSSCSHRVRIALALKNIAYTYVPVDLLRGDQNDAAFAALNPMHAVPTLAIDGLTLTQSGAIIQYLDETRPQSSLQPHTVQSRTRARQVRGLGGGGERGCGRAAGACRRRLK